jgi:arabinogalactan endo-1,4-beta-galactosidase
MPKNALPPDVNFPVSVEGQKRWIQLLSNTVKRAGAIGLGWYEPAWLTNPTTGSNFESTLLFDKTGKALPSLATFKTI